MLWAQLHLIYSYVHTYVCKVCRDHRITDIIDYNPRMLNSSRVSRINRSTNARFSMLALFILTQNCHDDSVIKARLKYFNVSIRCKILLREKEREKKIKQGRDGASAFNQRLTAISVPARGAFAFFKCVDVNSNVNTFDVDHERSRTYP
jgi:hypothetical protein